MAETTKPIVRNEKPITGESIADQMKRATENGTLGASQDAQAPTKALPKRLWYPYGPCPNPENK